MGGSFSGLLRLSTLSAELLFQMWLSHPSQTESPPENTALQALHVTKIPLPLFFPSLFPPLLLLLLLPLLAVAAYHLDCAKSPQDCMKDPLVLLCKPQRLEKCTASPPTHPAALRTWKSSRCFTPTYEINDDIDMQIPARARCVMILSFFDSCVIAAFYYWRGLRALKALIPQAEALTVNIQLCLCFVFFSCQGHTPAPPRGGQGHLGVTPTPLSFMFKI